jgi:hypothetical protein
MSGYPMEPQLRLSHANATMVGLRIFSWHGTATAFVVVIATPDWRGLGVSDCDAPHLPSFDMLEERYKSDRGNPGF